MKRAFPLATLALALLAAAPASADVVRYATGNYTWTNGAIRAADGTLLKTINTSPNVIVSHKYTDTVGIYGGGDTASGRLKAKSRAITKALNCNWAFYVKGKPSDLWAQACPISGVTVNPEYLMHVYFEDFTRARWCPVARQVAAQFGIAGPVYVSSDIGFFGDAAGTESDMKSTLGSIANFPCY
jgi:hypothetical protein